MTKSWRITLNFALASALWTSLLGDANAFEPSVGRAEDHRSDRDQRPSSRRFSILRLADIEAKSASANEVVDTTESEAFIRSEHVAMQGPKLDLQPTIPPQQPDRTPTMIALSDIIEASQNSPSDFVSPEVLPEPPAGTPERLNALFDDEAQDDQNDAEADSEEDDDEKSEDPPVNYPADLQQMPQLVRMSIWDARRTALENNKDIRVIAFEPMEAQEEVGIESAEFDHVLNVGVTGGKLDEQVSSQIQANGVNISALQTDFFQSEEGDLGGFSLEKQLSTGGKIEYGYDADYNYFSPAGNFVVVNPAWVSRATVRFEQPLFKGRGAAIALAPIETAQAEQQLSMGEFNTLVHETLRDLEVAYWEAALAANSYQWLLEAARRSYETLSREEELREEGRGSLPDTLQAEEQYRAIRSELAEARADWGTASREVYRLLGIPRSLQQGYVYAYETPSVDALLLDPAIAESAVLNHPEFEAQLAAVRAAEVEVRVAANALQPDLAVRLAYAFSGLAENLDDAIDIMMDRSYNNWTIGMVFRHPFGRRAELATVRQAHLALSREQATLEQIEHDLLYAFQEGYELASDRIALFREQQARRSKAEDLLSAQQELYEAGRIEINLQLQSERALLDARIGEAKALAEAWTAATEFRYALGKLN